MGFRVLLISVTGKDPATVQREYGVEPTEQTEEIPESPVCGCVLSDGSYLLYINDRIMPEENLFRRLSSDADLLACYANETTMDSLATRWKNGQEVWSVFHSAQHGVDHLETTGELPSVFQTIRDDLFRQQETSATADYIYDIPVQLIKTLGGFTYDGDIPDAEPFYVLKRT